MNVGDSIVDPVDAFQETFYVYVLECPVTKCVRYVGSTNNPMSRYMSHLTNARNKNDAKSVWIRRLIRDGKYPVLRIIAKGGYAFIARAEQEYFDANAGHLLNKHRPRIKSDVKFTRRNRVTREFFLYGLNYVSGCGTANPHPHP